jgi:hypothetical protein
MRDETSPSPDPTASAPRLSLVVASIGGYANQRMMTAERRLEYVLISDFDFHRPFPPKVTPCACDSTQWGFWSAFNGATNSNGQLAFEDQGALLLWVAGVPTSLANLPATGMATYTGHAIANIANPNNITSYLAAGTFSNAVNFGTHMGTVTIGGLDGTNYAGKVQLVPSAVTFNGTLAGATPAGSPANRTATLAGSFFQGGPPIAPHSLQRWAVRSS